MILSFRHLVLYPVFPSEYFGDYIFFLIGEDSLFSRSLSSHSSGIWGKYIHYRKKNSKGHLKTQQQIYRKWSFSSDLHLIWEDGQLLHLITTVSELYGMHDIINTFNDYFYGNKHFIKITRHTFHTWKLNSELK